MNCGQERSWVRVVEKVDEWVLPPAHLPQGRRIDPEAAAVIRPLIKCQSPTPFCTRFTLYLAVHRSSTIRPLYTHTNAIVIAIYTPFHILIPVVSSSTGMRRVYLYYHPTRYHHISPLFSAFIFYWQLRVDSIIPRISFILSLLLPFFNSTLEKWLC